VEGQPYHEQVKSLGAGVKAETGLAFILASQTADKPEYPFYAYSPGSSKLVENIRTSEQVENDVTETWRQSREITFTISAVTLNTFEALELIENLKNWLKNTGYAYLSQNEIVFVKCSDAVQRDVFIINDYERRWSVDCVLRFSGAVSRTVPLVEKVILQEGVIIK
jgi:hypothetical protein